jgi:hypothetical protein
VRTTISPPLQKAAVASLGGQLGGIVAMQPATGQILAVAGIGLDGLQPPGSTFKMVTLTGALAARVANPETVFPYATYALLDGVRLHNANGEECGGTLENAFAVSCNSVFTPLGVKLGSARLVQTAEAFGFNHAPDVPGAAESTLPAASEIHGELDIGSTAIGQGRVIATPLQMATVAATIADGGRRPRVTCDECRRGAHGAAADDPRRALGHRHCGGDPGRGGRGQDGHGRTEDGVLVGGRLRTERRIGVFGLPARKRTEQHRRLVRGVRSRRAPADRGLRAARQKRRRRGDGGTGGTPGDRSRAAVGAVARALARRRAPLMPSGRGRSGFRSSP